MTKNKNNKKTNKLKNLIKSFSLAAVGDTAGKIAFALFLLVTYALVGESIGQMNISPLSTILSLLVMLYGIIWATQKLGKVKWTPKTSKNTPKKR